MKPTEFMEWSERDRVLAEALIEFEDTAYCPGGCGQLISKAWDPDTVGSWEMPEMHCYACEARANLTKNQDEERPGVLPYLSLNDEDVERAKKVREARKQAQDRSRNST